MKHDVATELRVSLAGCERETLEGSLIGIEVDVLARCHKSTLCSEFLATCTKSSDSKGLGQIKFTYKANSALRLIEILL